MRTLLQFHAFVDAQDPAGYTSVNASINYPQREKFVKILLDAGANTEIKNNAEQTPLFHASMDAYPGTIRLLCQYAAETEARNMWGFTCLHIACLHCTLPRSDDRFNAVVALAEGKADLHATVECPDSEIGFVALQRREEERRRLAVDRTALWKCSDMLGWKPTHPGARKAQPNKVLGKELKAIRSSTSPQKKKSGTPQNATAAGEAVQEGDDASTSDEEYEQFSPQSQKGRIRADSSALRLGQTLSCESLLSEPGKQAAGMGDYDGNEEGRNGLIIVACQATGGEEVAKYLVQAGTDPEFVDAIWGRTALMWAAIVGRWQMCQALLEAGAHPDTQNEQGRTALIQACRVGNDRHAQVIVDWRQPKANLEIIDENKHSALITSIVHHQNKCTALLLAAKAHGDDVRSGYSPLIWSVNEGTDESLTMLLKYGVAVELQDKHGWTALFHAAAGGFVNKAIQLLEAGALTEARDCHQRTPIMIAAHYNQQSMVELLLNAGALGGEYHNPTCAQKVEMAAGESGVAARGRGLLVEQSGVELTLTLDTPLSLMRKELYNKRGGF